MLKPFGRPDGEGKRTEKMKRRLDSLCFFNYNDNTLLSNTAEILTVLLYLYIKETLMKSARADLLAFPIAFPAAAPPIWRYERLTIKSQALKEEIL